MDAEVYTEIKSSVKRILKIDLNYYKEEQMKRRLDSWLVRCNAPSWDDYFKAVSANPEELSRFRNYLTINVTEFFRDADRWAVLRKTILPPLLKEAQASRAIGEGLHVWSAGCSVGVEAYTLSMLLEEEAPKLRHSILASDLDRGALARAQARGPYNRDEVRNLTPEQRAKFMENDQPPHFVKPFLASRVRFLEQNLLQDRFDNNFDLIVCRNVIIYFTEEAKSILYRKFYDALRPGGILFLGGTEIIPRPQELGFRNQAISFYLKEQNR